MKIRTDFVSNSSSSSFVVAFNNSTRFNLILKKIFNNKLNYLEFINFLNYYEYLILKAITPEQIRMCEKFDKFVLTKNTITRKSWDDEDASEYFAYLSNQLYDYTLDKLHLFKDLNITVKTHKSDINFLKGRQVLDYWIYDNQQFEESFDLIKQINKYFYIYKIDNTIHRNDIIEFIKTLSETEFTIFLDTILALFNKFVGDEYESPHIPVELQIIDKYN